MRLLSTNLSNFTLSTDIRVLQMPFKYLTVPQQSYHNSRYQDRRFYRQSPPIPAGRQCRRPGSFQLCHPSVKWLTNWSPIGRNWSALFGPAHFHRKSAPSQAKPNRGKANRQPACFRTLKAIRGSKNHSFNTTTSTSNRKPSQHPKKNNKNLNIINWGKRGRPAQSFHRIEGGG